MRLVLVVWLLVSSVAGEEWYMTNWVDCFAALSVESKASGSEITRAVRRVTSLNHPDRCKTPECAVRFADANSCKETLLDPKKRASYEEILAQGGPRIAPIGPPKTSAMLILILLTFGISFFQYRSLKSFAETEYRKEVATLVARKKFSPEIDQELLVFYRLDSKLSLVRELWIVRTALSLPSLLRSSANVATASTSSVVTVTPTVKRDPSSAAVYALLHQGLKLGLAGLVLWMFWAVLTGATGSQSPLFVVREDMGNGFSRGDLLVLQWGKLAFERLRAGDVLVYQQMASDPLPTVSRITAVHKEGSGGRVVVGGEIWIMTKRDDYTRDDRKLRLDDSSDQYFFGRDEKYPGRVVFKIPYIGAPVLFFGDASVFMYLLAFIFLFYSLIQAGQAAKKARLAARAPAAAIKSKLNKSQ